MLEAEPTGQRCYRATGSGRNECVAYRFASIGARSCLPCIPPWSLRLGLGRECHLCRVAGNTVTLCDPMWHVSSRSGVATLRTAPWRTCIGQSERCIRELLVHETATEPGATRVTRTWVGRGSATARDIRATTSSRRSTSDMNRSKSASRITPNS